VVRAIQEVSGLEAEIKWPNDVLISGKKVCGILIENEVKGNAVRFSLIGMGLNVDFNSALYPEVARSAGSLSQEEGVDVSCSEVMVSLFTGLEKLYLEMQKGVSPYEEWRKLMNMENKLIRVKDGEQVREGKVVEVLPDGALILLCADGGFTRVVAGDVFLQRTSQRLSF
jgi:BirA family biotin operon repressor/biotin-[acetyl-CoA-carboxylase] ligase